MKTVAWALFLVLLMGAAVVCAAIYLAVEKSPAVARTDALAPNQVERAKLWLLENDPRNLQPGTRRTVRLAEVDLDAALNYALGRIGRGSSEVVLRDDHALLRTSIKLPANPLGSFLNFEADLDGSGASAMPRITRFKLGRLPVPSGVANFLLAKVLTTAGTKDERLAAVVSAVHAVRIRDGVLMVTYAWESDLMARVRRAIIPRADLERLRIHHLNLVETVRTQSAHGKVMLRDLIQSQFSFAASRASSVGAIAENRAAIIVLSFFVNGKDIGILGEAAGGWPSPAAAEPLLRDREDFSQHFITSAALAANAGAALSDAVGVFKEIEDARGGSGFSFNDIAADLAGTRFGSEATSTEASARALQRRVISGIRDADLIPETRDLPEFLPEAEFRRRYTGVGSPAYERMMADIRSRVDALPLYR